MQETHDLDVTTAGIKCGLSRVAHDASSQKASTPCMSSETTHMFWLLVGSLGMHFTAVDESSGKVFVAEIFSATA